MQRVSRNAAVATSSKGHVPIYFTSSMARFLKFTRVIVRNGREYIALRSLRARCWNKPERRRAEEWTGVCREPTSQTRGVPR